MKFGALTYYPQSQNLGDYIQTIAAENLLPRVDAYFDRDRLDDAHPEERHAVLMNGWFSSFGKRWPPSDSILPIFVGFHMTKNTARRYLKHVAYFKKYQPIGCRDRWTEKLFREAGVEAYTIYCPTLTLTRWIPRTGEGRVFVIDADEIYLPRAVRERAVFLTHTIDDDGEEQAKIQAARDRLEQYQREAALIVTTRVHAALPALAMGIPVVFFGNPWDGRQAAIRDMGLKIHNKKFWVSWNPLARLLSGWIDWSGATPDVSAPAQAIRDDVAERVNALVNESARE